ncbi:phosphorylated adapter RNA export protein-like [Acanthaster planci]|uniref:Phosphorylated adapter RNA export protein n=1 Tax=Acanthaster planci TaxID=133434 RepID=A0A8B7ZJR0_ACAPL|nr:phosphorylated adapter RNA export protein-like [Acanthaster planci]XP_022105868.1 phosphorylated adapter RNA export protein-like [Acanthaster planci]
MASYRDVHPVTENSSDDSSSDSDDSEEDQPWKRRKTTSQLHGIHSDSQLPTGLREKHDAPLANRPGESPDVTLGNGSGTQTGVKRPRRNNVWGQVVQEQNEALVAREMDEFEMDLSRSRDVESYNYKLSQEENISRVYLGAPSVSKPESGQGRNLKRGFGETDEDNWLVGRHVKQVDSHTRRPVHERLGERDAGLRQTVKARLGSQSESSDLTPMKFIPINPLLSKKEITGKLAYSLQEAKRELIVRVVNTLGVEKSLELWKLTADTEKNGGMMTVNGSRRRSPGGVFLQLMKTDPQVTQQQIHEIFAEERKKDSEEKHKRQRKKRRRKKTVKCKDNAEKIEGATMTEDDQATEMAEEGKNSARQPLREVKLAGRGDQASEMEEGETDGEEEEQDDGMTVNEENME